MIGTRNVVSYPGGKVLIPSQCNSLAENAGELPNEFAESSMQLFPLGSLLIVGERKYRYCRNAASGGPGKGVMAQAAELQHADADAGLTVAVTNAVGDKTVSITGTTNLSSTVNFYKEGFIYTDAKEAGGAQCLKILSHPALNVAATKVITLQEAVLRIMTAATDTIGLIQNPYDRVIAVAAAPTTPLGVPQIAATASYYFWLQTGGPAAVLVNNTIGIDTSPVAGTSAGEIDPETAAATHTETTLGTMITAGVTDKYCIIFLRLD